MIKKRFHQMRELYKIRSAMSLILILCFTIEMISSSVLAESSTPSIFAQSSVQMAEQMGYLKVLNAENTLSYQTDMTRLQFCQLIVQYYEVTTGQTILVGNIPFTDTTDVSVNKAYQLQLIKGHSETRFDPDANISRQELMVLMVRVLTLLEKTLNQKILMVKPANVLAKEVGLADIEQYKDWKQIGSWAVKEAELAVRNELIYGASATTINPLGNASIEQAIVFLVRMASMVEVMKVSLNVGHLNCTKNGVLWENNLEKLVKNTELRNVVFYENSICLKRNGKLGQCIQTAQGLKWEDLLVDGVKACAVNDNVVCCILLDGTPLSST